MWRLLRGVSSFLLIDRLTKRVKEIAEVEPSLDEALERYNKAHRTMVEMEAVIQAKHNKLQRIINQRKGV
jgi:exonuclease VII small subunit|tara:strand:- start:942 stop:1151 length:210 start_codon:yes stop_codon:yes gene_type:complete